MLNREEDNIFLIMFQLFLIEEYFTNGYFYQILNILSVLAIITGVLTILSKNPIVSILFLIALFASISSYLIIVGLSFIGLSYLIVYIGAVSILFLFILMLINVRTSELQSNTTNSTVLAILVAILSNYALQPSLPYNIANYSYSTIFALNNLHNTSFSFSPKLNNSVLPINIDNPDVYFVTSKS
jgi:NADH-ubiquinone oxidoreductase chain 6